MYVPLDLNLVPFPTGLETKSISVIDEKPNVKGWFCLDPKAAILDTFDKLEISFVKGSQPQAGLSWLCQT